MWLSQDRYVYMKLYDKEIIVNTETVFNKSIVNDLLNIKNS